MNTTEFVAEFEAICLDMIATMKRKNADYARGSDPFKNLRRHGTHGIVVRLDDKISRLDSLTNPASDGVAQVKDESIEDTAKDAANYSILLIMLHRQLKREAKPVGDLEYYLKPKPFPSFEEIREALGDGYTVGAGPHHAIAEIPQRRCSACPPHFGHNAVEDPELEAALRSTAGVTTFGRLVPRGPSEMSSPDATGFSTDHLPEGSH